MKVRCICFVVLPLLAVPAFATAILETAGNFAVLGGAGVTNSGSTTLTGLLGTYPNSSITGLSSITVNGTSATGNSAVHIADTSASTGESDLKTAILGLDILTAFSLSSSSYATGNETLSPGIYSTGSSFDVNGALTLDFGNLNNASFIFQVGSALTAEVGSSVVLKNVGANDGVYWVMGAATGASATILGGSTFEGNILANTSISFGTGATDLCGSALAYTGSVTLLGNTIQYGCGGGVTITPPTAPGLIPQSITVGPSYAAPEPATLLPLGVGLLCMGLFVRWKSKS